MFSSLLFSRDTADLNSMPPDAIGSAAAAVAMRWSDFIITNIWPGDRFGAVG
jgi:hypothetical protein